MMHVLWFLYGFGLLGLLMLIFGCLQARIQRIESERFVRSTKVEILITTRTFAIENTEIGPDVTSTPTEVGRQIES